MPYKVNDPVGGQRPVVDDEHSEKDDVCLEPPRLLQRNRFRLVTLALIAAVNVLVFATEVLLSGMRFEVPTPVLVEMGAMYAPLVQAGELFRLFTPMFLHMDLMHLAFNMVALYSVGEVLERVLGRGNFLLLYFVGGITGNAVSYAADVLLWRRSHGERRRFHERIRPVRGRGAAGRPAQGQPPHVRRVQQGHARHHRRQRGIHVAGAEHLRERASGWGARRPCRHVHDPGEEPARAETPCASSWRWHGWRRFCC